MKFYNFDDILQTGVSEIDTSVGGLKKNEINIICGKHKSGKSTLAQKIAVMVGLNKSVIYVNREDTYENIYNNMKDILMNNMLVPDILLIQPDMSLTEIPQDKILADGCSDFLLIVDDNQFSEHILNTDWTAIKEKNITMLLVLQAGPDDTDEDIQNRYIKYPTIIL